jgi:hypothetical protein
MIILKNCLELKHKRVKVVLQGVWQQDKKLKPRCLLRLKTRYTHLRIVRVGVRSV